MTTNYTHLPPDKQRQRDELDLEILRLHDEGLSSHEIAQRIELSQSSVSRFIAAVREYL